jgi:RHS repeat-associated protein
VRQGRGKPQDCPFRYQGQYEDVETGLYYNRFRYYDPEAGQYISPDPLGLAGGPALYAYVSDPLR